MVFGRVTAALMMILAIKSSATAAPLALHTRSQFETSKWAAPENKNTDLPAPVSENPFTYVHTTVEWEPTKTAVVIVDLWDALKAPYVWKRMDELALPINETVEAARAQGLLVVHSPSGTMDFYKDMPQRARCLESAPIALLPLPERVGTPALPVDPTGSGWEGPVRATEPQKRQHPAIEIAEGDVIGEGGEVYGLLKSRGIENVILLGVHANFGLLDGPTGLRQMKAQDLNVLLVRDLTDSRYNAEMSPEISHVRGTELVVDYIEQLGFPTIASTDLTGKPAFRFAEDKRPHVAFIVSDDHYHADKTIPDFARYLRETEGFHVSVLHGEGGHSIPGMENLATADVAVVFVRRLGLPSGQLQLLRDYVAAGKPLVGLRTASHAFKLKNKPDGSYEVPEGSAEWGGFDAEVLGGSYSGHEANEIGSDIKNVMADHPILRGVEPDAWHSQGSLYNAGKIAEGAVILQEGSIPGVNEAVTWIREPAPGRGKVFYTSLGHPEDFKEPAFRQLLVNGLKWSTGTL